MNHKTIYDKIKKREPIVHLILWCMVLFYPYIKYMAIDKGYQMSILHEMNALLFIMISTYVVYLWFFPLKNKKKYVVFIVLLFVLNAFLFTFFDKFFHSECYHNNKWMQFISSIASYFIFSFVFFSLYSFKKLYRQQTELEGITRDKNRAELEGLKAQVNPHFLFNTLNTIYANALKKDDETAEMILKLSDNFRYFLHEGQNEYVSLKKEITHLKDYISLQEKRLSDKINLDFSVDIDNSKQKIAPLLLISFVENAFKYTSLLKGSQHIIKIKIALKDNIFTFYCENSFNENSVKGIDTYWKDSGIGIINTSKRLKLLYPNKHQLHIEDESPIFKVNLQIEL